MPTYRLMYCMSEGDFQMDVDTGFTIVARNKGSALRCWEAIDELSFPQKGFHVYYDRQTPSRFVLGYSNNARNTDEGKSPAITKFQILKPGGMHEDINGCPIHTSNDYVDVEEKLFIEKLEHDYSEYFTEANISMLSFEPIALFVEIEEFT